MEELNDEIVNKVLAEFMGYELLGSGGFFSVYDRREGVQINDGYTKSLDAQLPVMEKLGIGKFNMALLSSERVHCYIGSKPHYVFSKNKTIPKASAYALYKVIMNLKEREK